MFTKFNRHFLISRVMILLITGLLLSNVAVAADPEYDIEIVIIEDITGRYSKSENWLIIPEETSIENKTPTHSRSAESEKRIKLLSGESLKLNDEIKKIEDSNDYKVLLHTSWRQSGLDKSTAFPVHIASNKRTENDTGSYIEGDITLVLSRYLHVSGDLTFYRNEKDGYVPYPVKFDRRMRSRETHYIDHPMIGILVLTTPVSR